MDNKTIVGYPLNGVKYNAEDAQTYLCTRTSGIFSDKDHFGIGGIVENRYVIIQPGLAWMQIAPFGGISFALKESVQVYVEGGGDTDRTDLIVLRYDGNKNECSVACKKDSTSVERDNNIFELGLYKVFVEAGSTQIVGLGGDVQDVRLTDLCGIMKDGVTGIPVDNLVKDFEIKVQKSIDTFNADAQKELSDFETDALNAINSFTDTGNQRISEFGTNSTIAMTQFEQNSLRIFSEANEVIADLQQTENEFNQAVDAANGVVTNFTAVVIPDALSQFETEKQEHFSDFVDEGDATILDFKERGDRALENFDETIADVASGTDVMLQTAFNPSGQVGQVAFEKNTKVYICSMAARTADYYPRVHFPFRALEKKQELIDAIKRGDNIVFRLFTIRTAGEEATQEEEKIAYDYINDGGYEFNTIFDTSKPAYDFRLVSINNVNSVPTSLSGGIPKISLIGMMNFQWWAIEAQIASMLSASSYIQPLSRLQE